jgi:hypothetical protein
MTDSSNPEPLQVSPEEALIQLQTIAFMSFEELFREAKARGRAMPACTGTFVSQYGLPCAHRVTTVFHSNSVLSLNDLNPH